MPQALQTIEGYTVNERKRDTFYMVFNTIYNDVHAFGRKPEPSEIGNSKYLEKEYTDYQARDEFINFMKTNFPNTKIIEVFDLVSANYLIYPYLGSFVIECEKDDEVFKALSEKYGNPYDDAIINNAVFWVIDYEFAQKMHEERTEMIEGEFGE